MPVWDAERQVDEPLVRALIGEQFPELPMLELRLLAEGWDNAVWLVNGELIFRFPRRAIAIPGVEREIAVLPELAPLLPIAIPAPTFIGRPSDAFPWPFFGARLIPGGEAAERRLGEDELHAVARPLGAFLRALHDPQLAARFGPRLPLDANRRADMAFRAPMADERLAELTALTGWRRPPLVDRLLADAVALPPPATPALVHGDLHARHLVFEDGGRLTGVIDWDDICLADPAIDLPLYWSLLPPSARQAFVVAYGEIPAPALLRSRVLALFLSAALAIYARHEGMIGLERISLEGLDRALA
jgi:aminoglycoside phosphotransferase (APT) family kinase protein